MKWAEMVVVVVVVGGYFEVLSIGVEDDTCSRLDDRLAMFPIIGVLFCNMAKNVYVIISIKN